MKTAPPQLSGTDPRADSESRPEPKEESPAARCESSFPKRAAIHTLGCRLNLAESNLIRAQLESAHYRIVPWGEPADVMVLNSCTVTAQADAKSRRALRSARRSNPEAHLAVTGCHAQLHAGTIAAMGLADTVVGNGEKLNLLSHLGPSQQCRESQQNRAGGAGPTHLAVPAISRGPFRIGGFDAGRLVTTGEGTRAHLKVQDGCDFMCAFCVIPHARGRSRSRALEDLLAEATALVEAGVKELVLTGVNVGTYEEDGKDLSGVVDALDDISGLARIRIGSIEPTTVPPGLLERMADPAHRLTPFLHLPLQSGSPDILRAMRRRYAPEEYRAFAEEALGRVPDLCLGADVMTGFPGEDDEAFADTVALLDGLPFAYFHVFPYSPRSGTSSVRLPGRVPEIVRTRRAAVLRALSDAKRREFHARFLGRTMKVLFERGKSRALAAGYTCNYIRVEVTPPAAESLRNRLLPVRLMEGGTSAMAGELLAL